MHLDKLGLPGEWTLFHGWEQFDKLSGVFRCRECKQEERSPQNCSSCGGKKEINPVKRLVVIVDEVDLYAPNNKTTAMPMFARAKIKQCRKFGLDFIWITQHESMLNPMLIHLTNTIWVCNSWFGGKMFVAKCYEPREIRKKDKHLDKRIYRFKLDIAESYDSLEVLEVDAHLADKPGGERKPRSSGARGATKERRAAPAARAAARRPGPSRSISTNRNGYMEASTGSGTLPAGVEVLETRKDGSGWLPLREAAHHGTG
jgi:hypothetical protein